MKYLLSANTDIGIKKSDNQDSLLVKRGIWQDEQVVLAVLCDGMGGLQKGEIASASAIHAFAKWFEEELPEILQEISIEKQLLFSWNQLIDSINDRIRQYGKKHRLQLGTTVTAMLFWKDQYYIAHVGDSRVYELKEKIVQLTKDQTLVQKEVDEGILEKAKADHDPRRNILVQCIGVRENVEPAYIKGSIEKDTVYVVCCDGFRHEINSEEIYHAFSPQKMQNQVVMDREAKRMIQVNKDRGEKDNISVIVIRTW